MMTAGIILWLAVAGINFGDSSLAAVIAAVASLVNAIILWRARVAQNEIARDVKQVKDDTALRQHQIEQLRSLSLERNRQILRLERFADRMETLDMTDAMDTLRRIDSKVHTVATQPPPSALEGGRRHYDPPNGD